MRTALQQVAQEISRTLTAEVLAAAPRPRAGGSSPRGSSMVDALADAMADVVAKRVLKVIARRGVAQKDLEARLLRAKRRLEDLATVVAEVEGPTSDAADGGLPNLEYARPKYKGFDSVLKYIEKDGCPGGLKLVIMNFND